MMTKNMSRNIGRSERTKNHRYKNRRNEKDESNAGRDEKQKSISEEIKESDERMEKRMVELMKKERGREGKQLKEEKKE